jgi:4-hydroxybenzoate polyprenyltransferase
MKKLLLRLGDYVFVTRPLILVPAWSFYLLGAAAGRKAAGETPRGFEILTWAPYGFYYGLACLTAILITAYLLNQIFDRESDRLNNKGHFLTKDIFSVRTVMLMAVVGFLLASYFFRFVAYAQGVPLILAVILALAYSVPPLRLVAHPFVDLLSNAVGYGAIAYVVGYGAWGRALDDATLLALPYVFLVGATFLHTTVLDAEGDRGSGKKTTTVLIGVGPSAVLACVLAVAGLIAATAISAAKYGDWTAVAVVAFCTMVFIHSAVRLRRSGDTAPSATAVHVATAAVTVPAVVAWPAYLIVLLPIVVAARFYYRARFGIIYPGPAWIRTPRDV